MNKIVANKTMTVLQLLIQNVHVCIELNYVSKVLPLPLLEVVPGAPAYLVGLLNLAGRSIPIIDLNIRLGMARLERYTMQTSILLISHKSQQTGIIVDNVLGLLEIEPSTMQMSSTFEKENSVFMASIPFNSGVSLLINAANITTIDNPAIDKKLLAKASKHHE